MREENEGWMCPFRWLAAGNGGGWQVYRGTSQKFRQGKVGEVMLLGSPDRKCTMMESLRIPVKMMERVERVCGNLGCKRSKLLKTALEIIPLFTPEQLASLPDPCPAELFSQTEMHRCSIRLNQQMYADLQEVTGRKRAAFIRKSLNYLLDEVEKNEQYTSLDDVRDHWDLL